MYYKLLYCLMVIALMSGCSEQSVPQTQPSQLISFTIDEDGNEIVHQASSLVFEVTESDLSFEISEDADLAWLTQTSQRRQELNALYYERDFANQEELREDMKRSKNWHTIIDGKSLRGYDVVRDIKGEFDDVEPSQTSAQKYKKIIHYE